MKYPNLTLILAQDSKAKSFLSDLISYCESKKVLLLTTSTRWKGDEEPKSTQLARLLNDELKESTLIEVPTLKIYECEGNVSKITGNNCGIKESLLKDESKNPSGYHRCWASFNNQDDELWKITKEMFNSDIILFFASQRWGQTNSVFQKLIERLSWIENRKSTLEEDPIPVISKQKAGMILFGHNWMVKETLERELKVLEYFGWDTPPNLSYSWQYTKPEDETQESYLDAVPALEKDLGVKFEK